MRNRLAELLPDIDGIHTDIVIEPSLAGAAHALLSRLAFSGKNLLLVCDADTYEAFGKHLAKELAAFSPRLLTLRGKLHADEVALKQIRNPAIDAYVAVGSGTINDLCKYASFLEGKPYVVFPTAPSMNGYLSANASITINGVKESRAAHLPIGVFCDLEVIGKAPKRLIQSGLGDSLCRSTAQADWLLSHLLLDTPYSPLPFNLLAPYETELFAHTDKLIAGDMAVLELLLKTLLVSGLGMTLSGGSYPASQGEHLIAHTMEMKHPNSDYVSYHGEQIGVTTLTMAGIQQELLSQPLQLPTAPRWEEALENYFGTRHALQIATTTRHKYKFYEQYDMLADKIQREDANIRDAIRIVTLPEATLRKTLAEAKAPTLPRQLCWDRKAYETAVSHARFTRDRWTFLDLLNKPL